MNDTRLTHERMATAPPTVSVVIPCRNEQDYIGRCLRSLLDQMPPAGGFELIVADGMSTDGTRAILRRFTADHASVRMIDNVKQIVSTGLNEAIAAARGDVIVRADVHTEYAPDYLQQCVRVLEHTGADNVGGPWILAPRGYVGAAIAVAFASSFGSGGARGHDRNHEGPVDTVYLGCWRRECFNRVGGFDEELVRNQDDEHNLRLLRAGGTVWQSPVIRSHYYPRESLVLLFQQYMQYGYWKVRVIQKHRLPASVRHLVPAVFVSTGLGLTALSLVWPGARTFLGGFVLAYATVSVAVALTISRVDRRVLPVLPAVFACFHIGYGVGFLRGVLDFVVLRRAPVARMTAITRKPGRTTSS